MMIDENILSRLRRGTVEAFVLHGAGVGLLFLMHVALGRKIGAEGYGVFSYALAIASVLAIVAPLGWPTALMRFIAQYVEQRNWSLLRGAIRRAYQITLLSAMLSSLALVGISLWPGLSPELATSLRFAALILPFLSFVALRRKALQGLRKVKSSIVPEEILLPLLVIIGVYLFAITTASGALLTYTAAAALAFVLGSALLLRSIPERGRNAKPEFETHRWMAIALPMVFGGIGQIIMNRTDVLMLGAMVNMESAGFYTAANRIAMLNTFTMTAVSIIAAPMIASAFYGRRFRQASMVLRRSSMISTMGALPLFTVMIFLPSLPLSFFGSAFLSAEPLLQILAFGQFVNAATGPVGFALVLTGRERSFAWATGAAAALNVASNLLLIPIYGAIGAAVATAGSVIALNLCLFVLIWKRDSTFRRMFE